MIARRVGIAAVAGRRVLGRHDEGVPTGVEQFAEDRLALPVAVVDGVVDDVATSGGVGIDDAAGFPPVRTVGETAYCESGFEKSMRSLG
jgi:hypothetical protein